MIPIVLVLHKEIPIIRTAFAEFGLAVAVGAVGYTSLSHLGAIYRLSGMHIHHHIPRTRLFERILVQPEHPQIAHEEGVFHDFIVP